LGAPGKLHLIAYPLYLLFKRSLNDNIFPSCWKTTHVLPLFKKDDSHISSNYRPVSLLGCLSKILERVVFKYGYNDAQRNNMFYRLQAGFLPGISTIYQLLELYHYIVSSIDDRKHTCTLFVTCQKHLTEFGIKV